MYKITSNTRFPGNNLVFMPKCHSTNEVALDLIRQFSVQEGTVVITNDQYSGKGQRGNQWESEPEKNLTLSVVFRPEFLPVHQQFYLNIFVSLAVYDVLIQQFPEGVKIKWPNDVLINGRKIGGILIENSIQANKIEHSVAGIGLNINQGKFKTENAVSLSQLTGKTFDLNHLFNHLLETLEHRYQSLKNGELTALKKEYLDRLFWIHEVHTFSGPGQFMGKITGIDELGRLIVHDGRQDLTFDNKEILYIE